MTNIPLLSEGEIRVSLIDIWRIDSENKGQLSTFLFLMIDIEKMMISRRRKDFVAWLLTCFI